MRHSRCNGNGVLFPSIAAALIVARTLAEECKRDNIVSSSLVQGALSTRRELTVVAEEEEDSDELPKHSAKSSVAHNRSISAQQVTASVNASQSAAEHVEHNQSSSSLLWLWLFNVPQQLVSRTFSHQASSTSLSFLSVVDSHDLGKAVLIFMTPVLIVLLISACSVGFWARPSSSDDRLAGRGPPVRRISRNSSAPAAPPAQRDRTAMFLPSNVSLASAPNMQPPPSQAPASAVLLSAGDGSRVSMPDTGGTMLLAQAVPKSYTVQEVGGPHLCPDLVVPEGHECTLLVPCLPPANSGNANVGHATIDDGTGSPVCQLKFSLLPDTSGRRLQLSSAAGDSIFAYCKDCEAEQGSGNGLTIHHPSGNTYGVLRLEGGTYSVATRRGWRLLFQKDAKSGCLNATDERGRLLAMAESVGASRRSLRIGPLVDAGLIASALLGMDLMEHERSKLTPRSSGRFGLST